MLAITAHHKSISLLLFLNGLLITISQLDCTALRNRERKREMIGGSRTLKQKETDEVLKTKTFGSDLKSFSSSHSPLFLSICTFSLPSTQLSQISAARCATNVRLAPLLPEQKEKMFFLFIFQEPPSISFTGFVRFHWFKPVHAGPTTFLAVHLTQIGGESGSWLNRLDRSVRSRFDNTGIY